ncbi:MAG: serine/threonine protein phosphatase [Candidatus Marinimicrobia bacterium]|nr:serine/threonine protein phosphatase [Candidatus Neomarinimicrobiota bacterium]
MLKIYAIGDIHGCSRTFNSLLIKELKINKRDKVYCLGDYIDRGPDSKGVIDIILDLRRKGYQIHTLRGNHEQMFMDSINNKQEFQKWINNGGNFTMKSFNIQSYKDLSPQYKQFFRNTKYYIHKNNFLFVHAGFNVDNENIFEDKQFMLWKRGFSLNNNELYMKRIIHGHTPISINSIINSAKTQVINIDNGCVFKKYKYLGSLVAINLTENIIIKTRNID